MSDANVEEPPPPAGELSPGHNPFGRRLTRAKVNEQIAMNIFRMATYAIILAAGLIFGMIAWRGAPVVFNAFEATDSFPYVTNTFLATSPETLHVFPIAEGELPANTGTIGALEDNRDAVLAEYGGQPGRRNLSYSLTWHGEEKEFTQPRLEEFLKEHETTLGAIQREGPIRYEVMNQLGDSLYRQYRFDARWAYFQGLEGVSNIELSFDWRGEPHNVPGARLPAFLDERGLDLFTLTAETVVTYAFDHDGERLSLGQSAWEEWLLEQGYSPPEARSFSHAGGGILFPIVGTLLLSIGAMVIALVLGVLCAIYLSEYSRSGKMLDVIRLSVLNLAGVPSIVFGIFGFGMFVIALDLGVSLTAGCFTLAFMVLPIVIAASEESLRAVPAGFREGSLALGATKWQSIRTNVLPYALPGILTSSILGLTRVAGETAPIMYTAAFAKASQFPWEVSESWWEFFLKGVMALPYHIYVVSLQINRTVYTEPMQFGASFVFLVIVGTFALGSILLRVRMRRRYKW